jgi:hypothetical protein
MAWIQGKLDSTNIWRYNDGTEMQYFNWRVTRISRTYPWSFVTQIFHIGQPSHCGDRKMFEVMAST